MELDRAHVDALRVEEGEKLEAKMKRTREREAQLAAEAEDALARSRAMQGR